MKKECLLVIGLLCGYWSHGQIVQGVDVMKQTTVKFIEVYIDAPLLPKEFVIVVEYGQDRKMMTDFRVEDEKGKVMKFISAVSALNYMYELGWDVYTAYPPVPKESGRMYLMSRHEQ